MQTLTPERKARVTEYNKIRVEASYFAVEKVPMGINEKGKKRFGIVNRENSALLSEVSERYTLVRNQEIFKPFIEQFGYEAIRKFHDYGNGKYYYMEIETGRQFNFGTEEKPDMVDELLCIANSYNKTKSFTFKLGAFRWVCSNGLHSGEALVNYKKIHVGEIPVQKLVFQALLKFQDNTFDNWKKLKDVSLDTSRRLEVIEGLKVFDEVDKKGEKIWNNIRLNSRIRRTATYKVTRNQNEIDNQENGWGLYNQINWAIDREIGGKSQIDKRITANKRMEEYLMSTVVEQHYGVGVFLN